MINRSQSRYFPYFTLNLTPSGGPPSAGSAGASMACAPPQPCVNGPGAPHSWPSYFDPERDGGECANCGTRKPKASASPFCLICGAAA